MNKFQDDGLICVWPDGTWCLYDELEEYLNPPCAMSDDYKEVCIDSEEAKAAIGE